MKKHQGRKKDQVKSNAIEGVPYDEKMGLLLLGEVYARNPEAARAAQQAARCLIPFLAGKSPEYTHDFCEALEKVFYPVDGSRAFATALHCKLKMGVQPADVWCKLIGQKDESQIRRELRKIGIPTAPKKRGRPKG